MQTRGHQVSASIYNLSSANYFLQSSLSTGVYHVGIEIYGLEWSYGFSEEGTGIFFVKPRQSSIGIFKESVKLGETYKSPEQVMHLVKALSEAWRGKDYDVIHKNCVRFSQEFLRDLVPEASLPGWCSSAGDSLAVIVPNLNSDLDRVIGIELIGENTFIWNKALAIMRQYQEKQQSEDWKNKKILKIQLLQKDWDVKRSFEVIG